MTLSDAKIQDSYVHPSKNQSLTNPEDVIYFKW